MGGQSIASGGIALDMAFIKAVAYNAATETMTVGAGALWSDVIFQLNVSGKAPRTLQSYASFSVGGSLSVNAHGITSDNCVAESVVGATILTLNAKGERVKHVCVRGADDEGGRLLRHALGGYGLFGVIFDVTMTVANNHLLVLESIVLSPNDFAHVYQGVLASDDVAVKIARIDITSFDWISIYVFKRRGLCATVSELPVKPRAMGVLSSLMYKWLAGPLAEMRFQAERAVFGEPLVRCCASSVADNA
jgi:hypothetical protein